MAKTKTLTREQFEQVRWVVRATVDRVGGQTLAAEELGLSQQTVSKILNSPEPSIGIQAAVTIGRRTGLLDPAKILAGEDGITADAETEFERHAIAEVMRRRKGVGRELAARAVRGAGTFHRGVDASPFQVAETALALVDSEVDRGEPTGERVLTEQPPDSVRDQPASEAEASSAGRKQRASAPAGRRPKKPAGRSRAKPKPKEAAR